MIGADSAANKVDIYYVLDEKGGTEENPGDGTPDKYQITLTYVSEDTNKGTVTGETSELLTLKTFERNEDGTINEESMADTNAKPAAKEIEATPNSGYNFVNWTYGEGEAAGEAADVAAIRDITGLTKDTTFTAHFTVKSIM